VDERFGLSTATKGGHSSLKVVEKSIFKALKGLENGFGALKFWNLA